MNNKLFEKFSASFERILIPIAAKITGQRHISAIRDAFILIFPLTMAGSLMLLLNFTVLAPDGFIATLLGLHKIFPGLAEYQQIFSPVLKGSTDIMALLIVFLVGRNLAKHYKIDDLLTGLTSISVFLIIYPNYISTEVGNALMTKYMGPQGLFVAIFIGIVVAELMNIMSKCKGLEVKMPPQVPPAVARSFKVLIPIILTTLIFSILNFIITKFINGGLHELVYQTLQKPLTAMGNNIWSVIVLLIFANLLWCLGIHGPNTIQAIRDTMFAEANAANLQYVAENGTAWGAPFTTTWALPEAFASMGGSGMTLGLLIAVFLFSKRTEYKEIAKLSIAPGCFNINEPVIFGMPIVLNPIMIIPFIFAPVVSVVIGYLLISFEVIPPIAYSVPWTTPGPIIAFLGTGGNLVALIAGIGCLAISILIYMPFIIAANNIKE